jgi:hypothetical protein
MSLRLLTCSLLLIALAVFTHPLASLNGQGTQIPIPPPKWEYKLLRVDVNQCALENELTTSLNLIGQEGWELVNYERFSSSFPKDADGTLLIRPAATGAGAQTTPQTADSFTGTITMRMGPTQAGGCRFMFKRQVRPQTYR